LELLSQDAAGTIDIGFHMNADRVRAYLRSFAQPVTALGLGMLVFIYSILTYLLLNDRIQDSIHATRRVESLVKIIDRSVAHVFRSADSLLLVLRNAYLQNPSNFNIATFVRDAEIKNNMIFRFTIADAGGRVVDTTYDQSRVGNPLRDREFFNFLSHAAGDDLLIGRPYVSNWTGNWIIIVNRRMIAADGTFMGVARAIIDVALLTQPFRDVELGPDGTVGLLGMDGYLRTRVVDGRFHPYEFERQIPAHAGWLARVASAPFGTYWNTPGVIDDVSRLVAYRTVEPYPLISGVAIAEAEVFRQANERARVYFGISLLLTCGILLAMWFAAGRQRRLDNSTANMQEAQQQLSQAHHELIEKQYAIDQAVSVTITDHAGIITYANDNFCRISGYSRTELLGRHHRIHISKMHSPEFYNDLYHTITSGKVWRGELGSKTKDGAVYWVDTTIVPQLGTDGNPVGYLSIRIDITSRKLSEARISYLASHDSLTGLSNRATLNATLEEVMVRSQRHRESFAVILLDLDGFKHVNDTLGHVAGDELLKQLAGRLQSSLRDTDFLARFGGDEFAIIQDRQENQSEAAAGLAVRLLDVVSQPFSLGHHVVTVGTSIGIALGPDDGINPGEFLQRADLALYRAKSEGRNNFRFFDETMSRTAAARLTLVNDLRATISRGGFELHYQPIVDARTCRPCGVEALLRWRHPVEGLLLPESFIPLAEETGLIDAIGAWVLQAACMQATAWPEHIKLAVNLSALQFRTGKLFDVIMRVLADSGLPAGRLELEITESVFMQDQEKYAMILKQLKDVGISVVLDDFGTGYSSLNYLTKFPFDKIKIDKSFTGGLTHRADCAAVVASVLTLARGLDIEVTAEGVETQEQLDLLRIAGVDQVQGYLFALPCPASELDFFALERNGQTFEAA